MVTSVLLLQLLPLLGEQDELVEEGAVDRLLETSYEDVPHEEAQGDLSARGEQLEHEQALHGKEGPKRTGAS